MSPEEQKQRAAVVQEALSWLRTPYHHQARLKGVGVDCAMILYEVFTRVGLVEPFEIPHYPRDWHLNRESERFMEILTRYATEIPGPPGPGDLVLWKIGRCFAHGAIVIDWPVLVHAYVGKEVVLEDYDKTPWLQTVGKTDKPREMKFFTYWKPGG